MGTASASKYGGVGALFIKGQAKMLGRWSSDAIGKKFSKGK